MHGSLCGIGAQGLKCNFYVLGTVKHPGPHVKISGPIVVLQWAPYIFNQVVILIKVKLTSCSKNFSCIPMKRRHLSGLGTSVSREKAICEAWQRWMAEIAGLGTAFPCVPAYFNPWTNPRNTLLPTSVIVPGLVVL